MPAGCPFEPPFGTQGKPALRKAQGEKMAKKKNKKNTEENAFLGSLDRLGGKKLTQHGAEESSRGRESRKHRVGGATSPESTTRTARALRGSKAKNRSLDFVDARKLLIQEPTFGKAKVGHP
jgi:hypothetical protein